MSARMEEWLLKLIKVGNAQSNETLTQLESRMATIEEALARLESGVAGNAQQVIGVQAAISAEIQQLATALAAGTIDTTSLVDRLNAVSDKIDASNVALAQSTNDLIADDAPQVVVPDAPAPDAPTDGQ